MKRIIIIILIGIVLVTLTFINGFKKSDDKLVVAEVTHSVFYAPWYVALNKNYFDDLNIEVILTSGANNVVSAVNSGDAQIGLCGPEATIYLYKSNIKDPVISFAGLTKRDGQFLVLRKNIEYKDFKSIEGKTILAGRSGGMPLLNFTNALKLQKVNNVNIDSSIDFANLTAAFMAGNGDGVNLFDDSASVINH